MASPTKVSGHCLCGNVKFTASVAKREVGICHCSMCQRWTAGPFLAMECEPGSLELDGADSLGTYVSSDWASRHFCKTCGTPLFWRSRDGKIDVISAGALDEKSQLSLTSEIFIDEKPRYYDFANETKRMTGAEFIAMMTGTPPVAPPGAPNSG